MYQTSGTHIICSCHDIPVAEKLPILHSLTHFILWLKTITVQLYIFKTKGETIHRMYRNCDYFGDDSVHDTWKPLTIQTI